MNILCPIPRIIISFILIAAIYCPCRSVWSADGADSPSPMSPEEKQNLIRKNISAHASEDLKVREEAQRSLAGLGDEAMKALITEIERSQTVQSRLEETLALVRDQALTPDEKIAIEFGRNTRVTFEFQEQPLQEVLEFLRQFTNLNYTAEIDSADHPLITLKIVNIPLENALNLITEQVGYVWFYEGHLIKFMPLKKAPPRRDLWIKKLLDKRQNPKDPDVLAIQNKLDNVKIEINFTEAQLEDVVEFIRKFSAISIVVDHDVRNDKTIMDRKVTFKARDLVLSECIKTLLSNYGLAYSIRERVIYISRPPEKMK